MKDLQYQLICQYLEGELPSEEMAALKQWRSTSSENEKKFQEVKFLWEKSTLSKPTEEIKIDVEAALIKVNQQLEEPAKIVNIRRRFLRITSVAAAVALLLMGGLWMLQSPEMIEVATASNEQKEIRLPDNSIVWLNENTILKYPVSFDNSSRVINMTGNAVFEVTHNKEKPFIVQSEDISVKVLGTKFNVNTRKEKEAIVHVINGKVQVDNLKKDNNQVIITKGMTALFNVEAAHLALTESYDSNELFWLNKTLNFSNSTLENVFEDLQKYYAVDIEIQNKNILTCSVQGEFKNKTVNEILETLQPIYNFEINKANSTNYKITKGQCN